MIKNKTMLILCISLCMVMCSLYEEPKSPYEKYREELSHKSETCLKNENNICSKSDLSIGMSKMYGEIIRLSESTLDSVSFLDLFERVTTEEIINLGISLDLICILPDKYDVYQKDIWEYQSKKQSYTTIIDENKDTIFAKYTYTPSCYEGCAYRRQEDSWCRMSSNIQVKSNLMDYPRYVVIQIGDNIIRCKNGEIGTDRCYLVNIQNEIEDTLAEYPPRFGLALCDTINFGICNSKVKPNRFDSLFQRISIFDWHKENDSNSNVVNEDSAFVIQNMDLLREIYINRDDIELMNICKLTDTVYFEYTLYYDLIRFKKYYKNYNETPLMIIEYDFPSTISINCEIMPNWSIIKLESNDSQIDDVISITNEEIEIEIKNDRTSLKYMFNDQSIEFK